MSDFWRVLPTPAVCPACHDPVREARRNVGEGLVEVVDVRYLEPQERPVLVGHPRRPSLGMVEERHWVVHQCRGQR